jgi:AcrR family transcriptional regulator
MTAVTTITHRRRLSARERRSRILDAAVEVFAERGYAAASMQEIARRADVVASVIYDHFPSKRQLYVELLELHGRALIERAVKVVPDSPPRERLRLSIEAFYEFVGDDPFVWRLLFRDPPADPEVAAVHRGIRDQATEAIAEVIRSGMPGAISGGPETARMLAECARAATDGLAGWWYEHREVPRERIVAIAMALLWEGFRGLLEPRSC